MTDFGMPALLELDGAEPCAALCRELGLRFVELNLNLPQYQPGEADVSRLRAIAGAYGIYYTVHMDENLNPWDFNPRVAEAYRQTAEDAIAFARALEAPVLTMHLPAGVYFTLPEGRSYLFERYRDRYLRSTEAFRDRCSAVLAGTGAVLCVENTGGFQPFQREALELLLESPAFGLTLDAGHSHSTGGVDEPLMVSSRLRHMHLHDARGRGDHLALGTGEADWPRYLSLARERSCRVVLETKTSAALRQSVEALGAGEN